MKVYIQTFLVDSAINRISNAIYKHLPKGYDRVNSDKEADFVIACAYGHRRAIKYYTQRLTEQNKKYAIVQLSVRSTPNPHCKDWIDIWQKAEVVWSYYNLIDLCKEDDISPDFNFYHAPLGVDGEVFKETKNKRDFLIASTGNGKKWNKECKNEIILAANGLGKKIFQLGIGEDTEDIIYSNGMDDEMLAKYYSRCEFVSGLRRVDGFELPIIEGLLCGARPITFERDHYRQWFEGLVEFIPEDKAKIPDNLKRLFIKGARPVTNEEKEYVKKNFNWKKIIEGLWKKVEHLN